MFSDLGMDEEEEEEPVSLPIVNAAILKKVCLFNDIKKGFISLAPFSLTRGVWLRTCGELQVKEHSNTRPHILI